EAVSAGAEVMCGGKRMSDSCYAPTVLFNPSEDCRVSREEIFGPVATIHRFETDQDAVEMANITEYGLAGSIWTTNTARGKVVAEQIDSGILWVNTWLHRDLRTPFGGVKNSGLGREGGDWSLNFFSEFSNICVIND
ncbi:MAG: aldehyde dehydrogenase family protein, partial [Candidatus Thermoplasmatota archaeon]|nr:aldehyde dehydrogenase family protein [Candidatus Thermoplasmatota archaeon]